MFQALFLLKWKEFSWEIFLQKFQEKISDDIILDYPEAAKFESLNDCILALVRQTGNRIVFIIDEWDAMIRETTNDIEA